MLDGRIWRSRSRSSPCIPPLVAAPEASSSVSVNRRLHVPRRLRRCGLAQVGKLVAEIPRKERRMLAHALGDALGEERPARAAAPDRHKSRRSRDRRRAPPEIVRKRPCTGSRSSVHAGSQLTPLMCPQKSVGIARNPASAIRAMTASKLRSASASIAVGLGWNCSHMRKKRTTSSPSALMRAMSSRISPEIETLPHVHRAAARPIVDAEKKAGHERALSTLPLWRSAAG